MKDSLHVTVAILARFSGGKRMRVTTKYPPLIAGMLLASFWMSFGQPVITGPPQTQAASPGTTVAFTIGASGAAPLAYQWQRNLGTGFADLAKCTNAFLSLTNVQSWDAADYRVLVTNISGVRTSAVAHLYVMRFAPVSTNMFVDNFDDNKITNWNLALPGSGVGAALTETNGQFTVYDSWPGVRTVYPWDTLQEGSLNKNWSLAEGQTIEFRIDLVSISDETNSSTVFEAVQDWSHSYSFEKGRDMIRLSKFSSGSSTFWCEKVSVQNTNVVLALALTRANPNVILTGRVLDKNNPNAVLYQHSVVDTPGVDPTFSQAQVAELTGCNVVQGADVAGAPYTSGASVAMGFFQYSDGHQPGAQVTYDNFQIREYDPVLSRYVDANSATPKPPYTNWATAARVIQDAVDAAAMGDEVIVTNGIYDTGGRAVGTNLLVNRVAVDKPLTLRSVNGPQFTIIRGYQVPGTTNGDGAIRCVYLANGASLSGFTLTNGATRILAGPNIPESHGGGAWCESTNALVSNCVLTGNSAPSGAGTFRGTLTDCLFTGNSAGQGGAASDSILNNCTLVSNSAIAGLYGGGGGAYNCTLDKCTITGNAASFFGGGACGSELNNCTLTGNSAAAGGGAYYCTLNSCTVASNTAAFDAGGVYYGALANCIVYFNTAPTGANYSDTDQRGFRLDYCCTTPMPTNGIGNITNAPLFVDYTGGNLRLESNSPCINSGLNGYAPGPTDLEGNPRIVSGTVDIGAYEYQGLGSRISYAWLQQYGLPTDGSADLAYADEDGMNNWQEWISGTCPTNAQSALRLVSAVPTSTNVWLTWQSVAGVNYLVERSTNLALPFTPITMNVVGLAGTTSYTDAKANGAGPFFYRVGVASRAAP